MDVELVAADAEGMEVVANLMQLYLHDFSELVPVEMSAQGTYTYPELDSYAGPTPDREAYVILVAGIPAGFALVRCDVEGEAGAWSVAEFFVVRGQRRRGVAREAARRLFQRHPGAWTLSYYQHNAPAASLWPAVVDAVSDRPVSRTAKRPPAVATARTILRFHVPAP